MKKRGSKMEENRKKIYIRTDGNQHIATGHLMRCLSIARSLSGLGAQVTFLVSDLESQALLLDRFDIGENFPVHCFYSQYNMLDHELETILSFLSSIENHCDYLLIDSYFVTVRYLKALKAVVKIAYIDDLEITDSPVDTIINYAILHKKDYSSVPNRLLGGTYTPLRKQFENVNYIIKPQVENIFITTGGTDEYNITCTLLKAFLGDNSPLKNVGFHVLVGSLNSYKKQIYQLASTHQNIKIHENVSEMASLMASCDLAISAGGTTLCELCAVGIPSISFCIADNQLGAVRAFDEKNIIKYAGDARTDSDLFDEILSSAKTIADSFELRFQMSQAGRNFTDGKGAYRIAASLLSSSN